MQIQDYIPCHTHCKQNNAVTLLLPECVVFLTSVKKLYQNLKEKQLV